jgi:hypothetical protein
VEAAGFDPGLARGHLDPTAPLGQVERDHFLLEGVDDLLLHAPAALPIVDPLLDLAVAVPDDALPGAGGEQVVVRGDSPLDRHVHAGADIGEGGGGGLLERVQEGVVLAALAPLPARREQRQDGAAVEEGADLLALQGLVPPVAPVV